MICKHCGRSFDGVWKKCPFCDAPIESPEAVNENARPAVKPATSKKDDFVLSGDIDKQTDEYLAMVSRDEFIVCGNCGFKNDPSRSLCMLCGTKLKVKADPDKDKKSKAIMWLAGAVAVEFVIIIILTVLLIASAGKSNTHHGSNSGSSEIQSTDVDLTIDNVKRYLDISVDAGDLDKDENALGYNGMCTVTVKCFSNDDVDYNNVKIRFRLAAGNWRSNSGEPFEGTIMVDENGKAQKSFTLHYKGKTDNLKLPKLTNSNIIILAVSGSVTEFGDVTPNSQPSSSQAASSAPSSSKKTSSLESSSAKDNSSSHQSSSAASSSEKSSQASSQTSSETSIATGSDDSSQTSESTPSTPSVESETSE